MAQKINGVVIYIDNGINEEEIPQSLIKSFDENNIIYISSQMLINPKLIIQNKDIIKLVIIDWALWEESLGLPSAMTEKERKKQDLLHERQEKSNIEFIGCCLSNSLPVVIFTKHTEEEITSKLIKYKIITNKIDDQPLLQISRKKSDISTILDEWYNKIPSAKLFDIAQSCILAASHEFFSDLIVTKNSWIKSLWDSFCSEHGLLEDSDFKEHAFEYTLVFKSFINHIINCINNRINIANDLFDEGLIKIIKGVISEKNDAKRILESINYVNASKISDTVMPGDIFNKGKDYYINIRAECDTARLKGNKVTVYLLKGDVISEDKFIDKHVCSICMEKHDKNSPFLGEYYQLLYNDSNFTIPFICDGKIIRFNFRDMITAEYDVSAKAAFIGDKSYIRIGRVLPPYSIKLQQRYSQYFSRVGLNPIPKIIADSH